MSRKLIIALVLGGSAAFLIWLVMRGKVKVDGPWISTKGTNVDTAGCPPGFRMRPARGMSPATCVPR